MVGRGRMSGPCSGYVWEVGQLQAGRPLAEPPPPPRLTTTVVGQRMNRARVTEHPRRAPGFANPGS
jgi:hypothetical protein